MLTGSGRSARTVTTKVRYPDFSIRSRSQTLAVGTDESERIAELACSLLDRALADRPGALRLVGVTVSNLEHGGTAPAGGRVSRETWDGVDLWVADALIGDDDALDDALRASDEAGLPQIAVSPLQGKMLYLMARMVRARSILEIGTLGGYSTIWLARALPEDGRLVSLEADERYAEVALRNVARAGLADRVDIRVGPALETLADVDAPLDFVFIDADKKSTPEYFSRALELTRMGGVIVGDNVVRGGALLDENGRRGHAGHAALRRAHGRGAARRGDGHPDRRDSRATTALRSRESGSGVGRDRGSRDAGARGSTRGRGAACAGTASPCGSWRGSGRSRRRTRPTRSAPRCSRPRRRFPA